MRKRSILIVVVSIVFFLTAITLYVNRVVLPVQIRKLAIVQAENFLKRKVEIGTLHFNWVKGLRVDGLKIYQKDSDQVFFQAQTIFLSIVWIPGFKQQRITIPSIDLVQPSVHLIHFTDNEWNFTDLLARPASINDQPLPVAISVGGVRFSEGKVRLDDVAYGKEWSEFFDHVDLNAGLSFKGVSFKFAADLPKRKGALALEGTYQPLSQVFQGQALIKNIKPADYLALVPPIKGLDFKSGLVRELNAEVKYSKDVTSAHGAFTLNDLNMTVNGQNIAGDVETNNADLVYRNGPLSFRGDFQVRNGQLTSGEVDARGNLQVNVHQCEVTAHATTLKGSLAGSPLAVNWKNGSFKGNLTLSGLTLNVQDDGSVAAGGKILVEKMQLTAAPQIKIDGSVELPAVALTVKNNVVNFKTSGELNNWEMDLGDQKSLVAETDFTLEAVYPLDAPAQLSYGGDFTLHHAEALGFPFGPFTEIQAEGEFKTDQVSLRSLSLVAMETLVKGAATVLNFKSPTINADLTSDRIDLAKLKTILPQLFEEYELQTSGEAGFALQFQGLAADPLNGRINIQADIRDGAFSSAKLKQSISKVSGNVLGTPTSLTWRNFTAEYLGKSYTLTGELNDFKNPRVKTSLEGEDVRLDTTFAKAGDIVHFQTLDGRYFNIGFGLTGDVAVPPGKSPDLDITGKISLSLDDLPNFLPEQIQMALQAAAAEGAVNIETSIKGPLSDWKKWTATAKMTSPSVSLWGYLFNDLAIHLNQSEQKINNFTLDGIAYDGKIHAVGSGDLSVPSMPFELALNVDALDLQKLKMAIPNWKSEELNGKFYLTSVGKGSMNDLLNAEAKGSLAIRDGFLTEFKLFKGLLGVLNEVLRLGQVMITEVEGNFVLENRRVTTDNLRLKSPSLVLLTEGWVDSEENCDLNVVPDLSSGLIPSVAEDVLGTLKIRIYGNVHDPKFEKKISMPQVINSIIKTVIPLINK